MTARRGLALFVGTVVWSSAAPARANEPILLPEVRGYVDMGGGVGIAQGDFARFAPQTSPSWNVQFGVGPKRYPVTFGLGTGAMVTASRSYAGPSGTWIHNGEIDFGPTTVTQRTELRHVELMVRLEPDWIRVRPFVELTGGVAQFWTTTTMQANWTGGVLDDTENAKDTALFYGLGAGLIVVPFRPMVFASTDEQRAQGMGPDTGSVGFALTLGVRLVRGTAIDYAAPETPTGQSTTLAPERSTLQLLAPYALLTFSLRTPDRPRPAPPP
jgi:hypothetical protein